jgi:hypothetical protein
MTTILKLTRQAMEVCAHWRCFGLVACGFGAKAAWYYGIQAYIYGFPLIVMDVTREVSTAVPTGGEITALVNQFAVMTKYPGADFRDSQASIRIAVAWAGKWNPLCCRCGHGGRYYVIALLTCGQRSPQSAAEPQAPIQQTR